MCCSDQLNPPPKADIRGVRFAPIVAAAVARTRKSQPSRAAVDLVPRSLTTGLLSRERPKPWTSSQPFCRRNSSCRSVSTPSAMTLRFSFCSKGNDSSGDGLVAFFAAGHIHYCRRSSCHPQFIEYRLHQIPRSIFDPDREGPCLHELVQLGRSPLISRGGRHNRNRGASTRGWFFLRAVIVRLALLALFVPEVLRFCWSCV